MMRGQGRGQSSASGQVPEREQLSGQGQGRWQPSASGRKQPSASGQGRLPGSLREQDELTLRDKDESASCEQAEIALQMQDEPRGLSGQEVIEFGGQSEFEGFKVPIVRGPSDETYLALEPPEARPYVVAPQNIDAQDVAAFVQQRLTILKSLQDDMLKHFSKTNSLKCHFKTGDVVHLLGRPFMLRVMPLSNVKRNRKPVRALASTKVVPYYDLSLIDLFVARVGNYEQGQAAFMAFAKMIFMHNIKSLLEQSTKRVFGDVSYDMQVKCRPMRDNWVLIDDDRRLVWFSESLIPYPTHAVVYAYLMQAIERFSPAADEATRAELIVRGVPNWREMRALLADPNNKYAL